MADWRTPNEIRLAAPPQFKELVAMQPASPEEVWLNRCVDILLRQLPASSGFFEPMSAARSKLQQLLPMSASGRAAFARRLMDEEDPLERPDFRLMSRDQSTGKEHPLQYGYLDELHEAAARANAQGQDRWVVNRAGQQVYADGQPVADTGARTPAPANDLELLLKEVATYEPASGELGRDWKTRARAILAAPITVPLRVVLGWTSEQHGKRLFHWGAEEPVDPAYKWQPLFDDPLAEAPEGLAEIRFDDSTVSRLAQRFIEELQEEVGVAGMATIAEENAREQDPKICHSHDLCDANMPMAAAFRAVMGIEPDVRSSTHTALWNKAWDEAKVRLIEMYPIKQARDTPRT